MFYNSYCPACDKTQTFIKAGVYYVPGEIHRRPTQEPMIRPPLAGITIEHDRCTYCQTEKTEVVLENDCIRASSYRTH